MTVVQESVTKKESIHDAARKLADYNMEESPDLAGIYLFPAEDIVRLVLLDPITIPSEEMVPYYFNAYPAGDVSYASAIVVIRPEEKATLPPPPGWGTWESAVRLWPQEEAHSGVRGVNKVTVVQEGIESIWEAAQRLADGNIQNSPDLEAIYWFPADHIIRLVMLDPVALPSEEIVPFFFGPHPQGGIPYPYAVALIRPEEKPLLSPPPDWGSWLDAVQLWPRK